jgi:hypothetical protein
MNKTEMRSIWFRHCANRSLSHGFLDMKNNIVEGTWVIVNVPADCACDRPDWPTEDGIRGQVTSTKRFEQDGTVFVLYKGRVRDSRLSGDPFPLEAGQGLPATSTVA